MNEKLTQAKEKVDEVKAELRDRTNKQRLLVVFAVFLLFVGGVGAVVDAKTLTTTAPKGTVIAGSSDQGIYALNATDGTKKWNSSVSSGAVISDTVVVDDTVYIGAQDKILYAVHLSNGTKRWKTGLNGKTEGGITVVNETVFVGTNADADSSATLHALNATTGARKWNFTGASDNIEAAPHVIGETVYIGSVDNNLYALHESNGTEKWNFTTSGSIYGSPTYKDGVVYVGSYANDFYAIYENGTKKWNFTAGNSIMSPATIKDGVVYFGSHDDKLYALHAEDGTKKWTYTANNNFGHGATVKNGTVYANSYDGNLYAINAKDGTKEWSYAMGGRGEVVPTVKGGTVYTGSIDDNVYALNADTGTKKWNYTTGGDVKSAPTFVAAGGSKSSGSRVNLATTGHIGTWKIIPPGKIELDITDYQEPNSTREYVVYRINDGNRRNVTENATVTSENSTVITVHSSNYTLESGTVNTTTNVTAEYNGLSDVVNVAVAEVDMNYIDILPPAYWITAIIVDPTMQWLFVAIVIGAVGGQMSRNKWAGMGTIQTVILIGWAIDLVDDGILMAAIAFLVFAGLITMQGSSSGEPIE